MLPALVIADELPVKKTPNPAPEMDAPALFVMLPPASISAPAPPAAVALMLPELARVAAPPAAKTPAIIPVMDAPAAFIRLPPFARSMPRSPATLPALVITDGPPVKK